MGRELLYVPGTFLCPISFEKKKKKKEKIFLQMKSAWALMGIEEPV